MNKMQILLLLLILTFLLVYIYLNESSAESIVFEDYEYCLLVTPDTLEGIDEEITFNRISLNKDSLNQMNAFYKDLNHALKIKDSKNVYVLDLSHSSFYQFYSLLDLSANNKVKQIILDENKMLAYLFPDCKIKSDTCTFVACFYTINSGTIDFELPLRE